MRYFIAPLVFVALSACQPGVPEPETTDEIALASCEATEGLRLNDIQTLGSHNSYKQAIPAAELAVIRMSSEEAARLLDYAHIPITNQLDLGMRQLELDIVYDPDGGLYADPMLPRLSHGQPGVPDYDASQMRAPGFKVLHVQDVDARSSCPTLLSCLGIISDWSAAHPNHTPILILVNAKQDMIELPGAVTPLLFDADAFDALDSEIKLAFPNDKLITPDQVRSEASTLREGVLANGWPGLEDVRGHIIMALDESPPVVESYMRGRASLEGLPLFINSIGMDEDHAAYFTLNDPLADADMIDAAVEAGFLVRTRADANTLEARSGDTTRREAAFASGAQYVSTDYYQPRAEFSDYSVSLPGAAPVRCNPLLQDEACKVCTE